MTPRIAAVLAATLVLNAVPLNVWAETGRMALQPGIRTVVLPAQTLQIKSLPETGLNIPAGTSATNIETAVPNIPGSAQAQAQPEAANIFPNIDSASQPQPELAQPQTNASLPAQGRLNAASETSGDILGRPGSVDSDSRRADFTRKDSGAGGTEVAVPGTRRSDLKPFAPSDSSDKNPPALPPPPAKAGGSGRGIWAYLAGVFAAQVANNALVVSLPLVLLHLGQSLGVIGFATTFTTALDMSGTVVSGWLTTKLSPETVLKASTWARAAALVAIPALLTFGHLTAPVAIALYAVDALARGVADTARNTMPMALVGKEKTALDALNSKARAAFNLGAVVGPVLVGLLALKTFSNTGNWLVAGVFAAAAAIYHFVPKSSSSQAAAAAPSKGAAFKKIVSDRFLRVAMLTSVFLALSPALRALLPPAFAESIAHDHSLSAWLVLAFGLGGTLGSILYNRVHARLPPNAWLKLGVAGAGIMAAAVLTGSFWPLAAGIFAFAALNETANLALTSSIQQRIPDGAEGGVMSFLRFTANGTSMIARFLMGVAFTSVASPMAAFALMAGGIGLVAAAQFFTSRRLRALAAAGVVAASGLADPVKIEDGPTLSPNHGYPGRLIAFEGLDGSGKSTQIELLKEELEAQGLKVVVTSWNSSELLSETIKGAKQRMALSPRVFALLNAADLAEREEKIIKPALAEGAIVILDRTFYTAYARDSVRGNKPEWLRAVYDGSLKPDAVVYTKLPTDTAISRVLVRTERRVGLSEDFDDEHKNRVLGQNPYAVGADVKFHDDPRENFRQFQDGVVASYDREAPGGGFHVVDATQPREAVHAQINAQLKSVLGPLQFYKKRDRQDVKAGLFDKDPAGDADNIKWNYLHDKKGAHFYFRNMLLPMQERFSQLMDLSAMPRVFLHANGHVDNYAKTAEGAAMVDFDRARVGPYAWELVRVMVSLSLRQKKEHGFLDSEVLKQLKKGYLRGFRHPDRPYSEMRKLKDKEPEDDEAGTDAYLKADKKWAHEMRANPLPHDDPDVMRLLDGYMKSRNEPDLLKEYFIEEAGRGQGSMGFRDLFLVVLAPRDAKSGKDRILLNIKAARTDPDTQWFNNPYATQAERMLHAAELYAPGWELRPGAAVLDGKEFYIHAVPPQNAKLKKMLDLDDQRDLAYAVGTQFGRAHRLSLQGATPEELEAHLAAHYGEIVKVGKALREEIVAAHERYLKNMHKRGLEPKERSEDE